MIKATLTRFASLGDRTVGQFRAAGNLYYSIECPWLDNAVNVSCIPAGHYSVIRTNSPKFGPDMWEITGVPGRSHILIHIANYSRNVQGCIGLGLGVFADLAGVSNSRTAIEEFYSLTAGQNLFEIQIIEGAIN